ncbi:MAG: cysteine dioxygenase family protein [Gammaproteobacteria bacterium]|nr:cysteine dioxygenase family protein [Gammaproteobacteria bacterium]
MNVLDLVNEAGRAAGGADPLRGVRDWLEDLAARADAVSEALAYLPGRGPNAEQAFYRSPTLTMLKVRFPVGRRTPPHNHGTWAAILVLSGQEKNTLYRVEPGDRLVRASEIVLEPGAVLPMRAEAAHVAECTGGDDAVGLHVYGGDIVNLPRTMWHPETVEPAPYSPAEYEKLARIASRAARAAQPG